MRILTDFASACLKLYRWILAPVLISLGVRCRFYPSCSHYSEQAIRTHGLVVGIALSCWRLLRCQPWSQGGYDPVPEKLRYWSLRNPINFHENR